jgi:hypothetical protein
MFDDAKDIHWIRAIESGLSKLGKLESIEVVAAMIILMVAQSFLPEAARLTAVLSGLFGIMLFVLVGSFSSLFEHQGLDTIVKGTAQNAGLMSFIYLEILL